MNHLNITDGAKGGMLAKPLSVGMRTFELAIENCGTAVGKAAEPKQGCATPVCRKGPERK